MTEFEKFQRLTHPKTAADYGLAVNVDALCDELGIERTSDRMAREKKAFDRLSANITDTIGNVAFKFFSEQKSK